MDSSNQDFQRELAENTQALENEYRARGKKTHFAERAKHELVETSLLALMMFLHGLIVGFGIGVLSALGWIIEKSNMSSTTKEVVHTIDDYLINLSFIVLGISFVLKIVLIVFRKRKANEQSNNTNQ